VNPRYAKARRPLFDAEMREKYPAAKSFHVPRERARQPTPAQAREVTLAKRRARKGRS
jgi:hypothetical protein